MNDYLKLKEQPATEAEFFARYGLSMKKASALLKKLHEDYKRQNPWCCISYERSYCPVLLTFLFEHAALDYDGMFKRIDNICCDRMPLHYYIAELCRVPREELEALIINGKKQMR